MGAHILVVEDNPVNMELVVYLLQSRGHAVTTALNGQEGLGAVARQRPDLVICDLEMPVMDGFGFLERLRREPSQRSIPVIAVTASSMPDDRRRVTEAGFDGYISKPITPETFVDEAEAHLRASPQA